MNRPTKKGKEVLAGTGTGTGTGSEDAPASVANDKNLQIFWGITAIIFIFIGALSLLSQLKAFSHESVSTETVQVGEGVFMQKPIVTISNVNSTSFNSNLRTTKPKVKVVLKETQFDESIKNAQLLLSRVNDILIWISQDASDSNRPYLRWDLIANADVHILHKLKLYLTYYLSSDEGKKNLHHMMNEGLVCNPIQAAQQELISHFINMDICSEVEWYKVAHLGMPEARTIFDVGANKGYLGSLFLTLWGGGGYHSSPLDIFNIAQKTKSWKNSRNPGGYCKDGFNQAISLYCPMPTQRNKRTGQCDIENEDLHIYSFDGSSYLTQTINGFINNHIFPDSNDKNTERRRKVWKYSNYAVSNKEGVARFTKQSGEKNAGFEGGSIQLAQGLKDALASGQKVEVKRVNNHRLADKNETEYLLQETEEVNMTSIDSYVKQYNIPKVDMLKIDTEGNDNKVILGAMNIIANQVGIFTFEGGGGVSFTSEMSEEFDSYGFNCYSTSRAGLFKWNKGCMKSRYLGSFRKKDKGNIFCVNRIRAPLVALAYDILSFPSLIDFHFLNTDKSNMNEKDKALYNALFPAEDQAGKNGEEVTLNNKIEQSVLMPIYINIYGFCRPWPSCLTNI